MTNNILKLHEEKTEFILFGTQQQLLKVMDFYMKNSQHINRICAQLYGSLRKIHQTRSHLDEDIAKVIVQALVLSRIDYCNFLLIRSAEYQLEKLQRVQIWHVE